MILLMKIMVINTEVLKHNPHDYNACQILVRGDIIITAHNNPTPAALKNCVPLNKCITKIDGTTVHDAEDLDLVMPMYKLIEYSSNCSDSTGCLWFYFIDEPTNFDADIASTIAFKSFKYKAK